MSKTTPKDLAKKRSDETLAAIEKNPGKFTMLTGDRPTGRPHMGHYFGTLRPEDDRIPLPGMPAAA